MNERVDEHRGVRRVYEWTRRGLCVTALKCVTEALPVAESLLRNWDNAWGSQMHHLTARAESADVEMDRLREQTEAALAEAEAYRAETVGKG